MRAPRFALIDRWRARRAGEQRAAELPGLLELLASALRSGATIVQAVREVAAGPVGPWQADLAAIAGDVEHGVPVTVALDRWAERDGTRAVRLCVTAIALHLDAGGALARTLDGLAGSLRDHQAVGRELRALSAQARLSALVVGLAPVAFAVVLAGVRPASLASFGHGWGAAVGLAGLSLDAAGLRWMQAITRRAS